MNAGFTKLKSSIITSSVWGYSSDIRIVWVTLLALADKSGFVECTIPGLARAAVVPIDVVEAALKIFSNPDEYSSDPSNDGRRIKSAPRGWVLLNYRKHRERVLQDDRREYQSEWISEKRSSVTVESVSTESRQLSTTLHSVSASGSDLLPEEKILPVNARDGAEPPVVPAVSPERGAIVAELRRWPVFADQDFDALAASLDGIRIAAAKRLEDVLASIGAAGGKIGARVAGGDHLARARIAETVAAYVTRASPPRDSSGVGNRIPRQSGGGDWKTGKEIS